MSFSEQFIAESRRAMELLDFKAIEKLADLLGKTRDTGGRLFILGVGGSAGHASHAVNDVGSPGTELEFAL